MYQNLLNQSCSEHLDYYQSFAIIKLFQWLSLYARGLVYLWNETCRHGSSRPSYSEESSLIHFFDFASRALTFSFLLYILIPNGNNFSWYVLSSYNDLETVVSAFNIPEITKKILVFCYGGWYLFTYLFMLSTNRNLFKKYIYIFFIYI